MYKTELIKRVSKDTRLSQRVVDHVLKSTMQEVRTTLAKGGTVSLLGFGTFYTRKHPAGKVRHIRTGKEVAIPAGNRVGFRVGELLKRAVKRKA